MKLIDLHCDTLWKLMDLDASGDFMENACSVSIAHMQAAKIKAQFFACFTYWKDYEHTGGYEKAYEHVCEMIDYLKGQTERYQEYISLTHSYDEMQKHAGENRISAFLTVEEGGVLNSRIERIDELYQKGVRFITLIWNYENCLGHPNSKDASAMLKGLTPFGIDAVKRMGETGMIVDVSHASDGTFWDVIEYAKGPVVASHSNCRAICNHPRNLSDDMIQNLADKGGVAGVNFYGPFLGSPKESKIDEMVAHVLHMIRVGGSAFPAIGTDFDGFDGMEVLEIPDVSRMELLWDALKKAGLSEEQLDNIWGGNAERVLKSM